MIDRTKNLQKNLLNHPDRVEFFDDNQDMWKFLKCSNRKQFCHIDHGASYVQYISGGYLLLMTRYERFYLYNSREQIKRLTSPITTRSYTSLYLLSVTVEPEEDLAVP